MGGWRSGVLAVGAVLVVGCGSPEQPQEIVAVPYPDTAEDAQQAPDDVPDAGDGGGDDAAAADGEAGADTATAKAPDADEPPLAAVREFLAQRGHGGVVDRDHLLADLSGDGTVEVVAATIGEDERRVLVEVGQWQGTGFDVIEQVGAGAADSLGRVRLADLGEQAPRVLLLAIRYDDATRVAVWDPDEEGRLHPPTACPVDGVATVRSSLGQRLTLACEPPGETADALVWHQGAFLPGDVDEDAVADLAGLQGPTGEG